MQASARTGSGDSGPDNATLPHTDAGAVAPLPPPPAASAGTSGLPMSHTPRTLDDLLPLLTSQHRTTSTNSDALLELFNVYTRHGSGSFPLRQDSLTFSGPGGLARAGGLAGSGAFLRSPMLQALASPGAVRRQESLSSDQGTGSGGIMSPGLLELLSGTNPLSRGTSFDFMAWPPAQPPAADAASPRGQAAAAAGEPQPSVAGNASPDNSGVAAAAAGQQPENHGQLPAVPGLQLEPAPSVNAWLMPHSAGAPPGDTPAGAGTLLSFPGLPGGHMQQQQHGGGIGGIHIGGETLFAVPPATAAAAPTSLHHHHFHHHHHAGAAAPGYPMLLPPVPLFNAAAQLAPAMFNLPHGFGLGQPLAQGLPAFNPAAAVAAAAAAASKAAAKAVRAHRKAQLQASRAARGVGGGGAGGGSSGADPAAGKPPSKRKRYKSHEDYLRALRESRAAERAEQRAIQRDLAEQHARQHAMLAAAAGPTGGPWVPPSQAAGAQPSDESSSAEDDSDGMDEDQPAAGAGMHLQLRSLGQQHAAAAAAAAAAGAAGMLSRVVGRRDTDQSTSTAAWAPPQPQLWDAASNQLPGPLPLTLMPGAAGGLAAMRMPLLQQQMAPGGGAGQPGVLVQPQQPLLARSSSLASSRPRRQVKQSAAAVAAAAAAAAAGSDSDAGSPASGAAAAQAGRGAKNTGSNSTGPSPAGDDSSDGDEGPPAGHRKSKQPRAAVKGARGGKSAGAGRGRQRTAGAAAGSGRAGSRGGQRGASPSAANGRPVFEETRSKYRGVTRHKRSGRWEAHLWIKELGRQVYLGGYEEEVSAAEAYDLAALKSKGKGCQTNFGAERYAAVLETMDGVSIEEMIMAVRRQSQGFSRGSSSYRGVTAHPSGRWESRIGVPGSRHIYLGLHPSEVLAAQAYDRALVRLKGATAATNFSQSQYATELLEHHEIKKAAAAGIVERNILQVQAGPEFELFVKQGLSAFGIGVSDGAQQARADLSPEAAAGTAAAGGGAAAAEEEGAGGGTRAARAAPASSS